MARLTPPISRFQNHEGRNTHENSRRSFAVELGSALGGPVFRYHSGFRSTTRRRRSSLELFWPRRPRALGDLDPSYASCKPGQRQSPIDIKDAEPADLKPIQFDYKLSPMKIVNNGHTILVKYEPGSSITVDGKQYPLVQFHFHHPSEEEINGQKSDMVLHFVHVSADGHAIAIAVLLKSGGENPLIRDIWAHIPEEVDKEVEFKKVVINAADLLPADQNYYTFDGSLTIPPCSDVKWFVMKTPVELSPAQIAAFAKLYPDNARPIQATNGRKIQESNFTE